MLWIANMLARSVAECNLWQQMGTIVTLYRSHETFETVLFLFQTRLKIAKIGCVRSHLSISGTS